MVENYTEIRNPITRLTSSFIEEIQEAPVEETTAKTYKLALYLILIEIPAGLIISAVSLAFSLTIGLLPTFYTEQKVEDDAGAIKKHSITFLNAASRNLQCLKLQTLWARIVRVWNAFTLGVSLLFIGASFWGRNVVKEVVTGSNLKIDNTPLTPPSASNPGSKVEVIPTSDEVITP